MAITQSWFLTSTLPGMGVRHAARSTWMPGPLASPSARVSRCGKFLMAAKVGGAATTLGHGVCASYFRAVQANP